MIKDWNVSNVENINTEFKRSQCGSNVNDWNVSNVEIVNNEQIKEAYQTYINTFKKK